MTEPFNFMTAMKLLEGGRTLARKHWISKDKRIFWFPAKLPRKGYIAMESKPKGSASDDGFPSDWYASLEDYFAYDWYEVDDARTR